LLVVLLNEIVLKANVGVKGRVCAAEWLAWLSVGDLHVGIVRLQLENETGVFHDHHVSAGLDR